MGSSGGGDAAASATCSDRSSSTWASTRAPRVSTTIAGRLFSADSPTFRSGQVGSSRDFFDDELEELFQSTIGSHARAVRLRRLMQEDDELLTRREAADRAGVTSGTIRLWERAGRLHAIPTGDRRLGPLFSAKEIEQAMRRSAVLRAASSMEAISHNAVEVQPSDDAPGIVAARAATGVFGPDAERAAAELEAATVESEIDVERETAGAAEAALAGRRGRGRPPAVLIRERLLRGSGWVLLGTAGATILGTAATGLIAHVLGKNSFGVYSLAFSIATIGGTLSQLGMERAVVRLVAAALGTDLPGPRTQDVAVGVHVGTRRIGLPGAAAGLRARRLLGHDPVPLAALAQVMEFVAIWVIAAAFQSLFAESFRSFQRFWLATLFNGLMFDVVAVLVFGWLFLQHRHITVAHAILLTVGAITVSLRDRRRAPREALRLAARPGRHPVPRAVRRGLAAARLQHGHVPGGHRRRPVGGRLAGLQGRRGAVRRGLEAGVLRRDGRSSSRRRSCRRSSPSCGRRGRRQQLEKALREVATLAGLPAPGGAAACSSSPGDGSWRLVYGPAFAAGATVLAILSSARLVAVITGNSGVALCR